MIMNKPVSLADQVFERLENEIYSGKYRRGDVITEPAVCEELGISRTPVHEAFSRLKYDHLVEESSKGAVVIGVSEKDTEIIYEIRKKVECMAAASCARNITDEQLKELRETVELQCYYAGKDNSEKVRECDSSFHRMLYRFSGSAVFYDVLEPLHRKIQKYREVSVSDRSRAVQSSQEHAAILDAIAARDEKAAMDVTYEHLCRAEDHIKTLARVNAND